MSSEATGSWQDFTEHSYRKLLRQIKDSGYGFVSYGKILQDYQVLCRHDVDVSVHRAYALAVIEAEERVHSTFFFNPRCSFYNLAEPVILDLVKKIVGLGHQLGLHFDAGAYQLQGWDYPTLERCLEEEKDLVERLVKVSVQAVSWHNPGSTNLLDFRMEKIASLTNAYSKFHWENFRYSSDSNGYWRYEPMPEVVAAGYKRLHLLTHPEWWTPEAMSPTARMDRAVNGRIMATSRLRPDLPRPKGYDELLASKLR